MSPQRQIRVIVGEDQPFVREGVVHVLHDAGFDVVSSNRGANGVQARMAVNQSRGVSSP